jgi:hypothetical protein
MLQLKAMIRAALAAGSRINAQFVKCPLHVVMILEVAEVVSLFADVLVVKIAPLSQLELEVAIPWALCVGPLEHRHCVILFEGHGL